MHQALAHIIDPGETRPRRGLPREGAAPGAPRHGATCPPELLRRPDPGASRPRGDLPPKRPATERFARPSSWSQPTPKRNNFPVENPQPPFCLELFNASSFFRAISAFESLLSRHVGMKRTSKWTPSREIPEFFPAKTAKTHPDGHAGDESPEADAAGGPAARTQVEVVDIDDTEAASRVDDDENPTDHDVYMYFNADTDDEIPSAPPNPILDGGETRPVKEEPEAHDKDPDISAAQAHPIVEDEIPRVAQPFPDGFCMPRETGHKGLQVWMAEVEKCPVGPDAGSSENFHDLLRSGISKKPAETQAAEPEAAEAHDEDPELQMFIEAVSKGEFPSHALLDNRFRRAHPKGSPQKQAYDEASRAEKKRIRLEWAIHEKDKLDVVRTKTRSRAKTR